MTPPSLRKLLTTRSGIGESKVVLAAPGKFQNPRVTDRNCLMKTSSPVALSLVVLSGLALHVQAQNPTGALVTRPRTVASPTPIQEKPSQKAEPVAPKIPTIPLNVEPPPPISGNPSGSPGG